MHSLLYIVLAAFGLGFLVFIHELGHYFMARKVGMKIEAVGIGFGKPFYTWERKGIKWNLCWFPFGGYVRIAGMEKQGHLEPYQIPGGFYNRKPIDRIKVALLGPIVNIVFAFIAFAVIWASGGREKPFAEFTRFIGWVDPGSVLYQQEQLRAGDEITTLNGRPYQGSKDLLYADVLDKKNPHLQGYKINYWKQDKQPFDYQFTSDAGTKNKEYSLIGTVASASYLIYNRFPDGKENVLADNSPLKNSGIQYRDRLIWADGQLLFSIPQLHSIINEKKTLLTVERNGQVFLTRIPRISVADLRLSEQQRAELEDWQHEAMLTNLQPFVFIPYNITYDCIVENATEYMAEEAEEHIFTPDPRSSSEVALSIGDRILAVDGQKVAHAVDLMQHLQSHVVQIIVQREENLLPISWKEADGRFDKEINWSQLQQLIHTIGKEGGEQQIGTLRRLNPVVPISETELYATSDQKITYENQLKEQKKEIEKIENSTKRAEALQTLNEYHKRLVLGFKPQDFFVIYNPSPFTLFINALEEIWRTLQSLVSGILSPKFMMGPIGIVQGIQQSWSYGAKEALFWMGIISLNLGILNLLPIPVLDGGYICLSLWEIITKKPIKAKTIEKLVIPFIVLLIGFFIFVTYHDLVRLLGHLF